MKLRAAASIREFEAMPVDRYVSDHEFCGVQWGVRHSAMLYRGCVGIEAVRASTRFIARVGEAPMVAGTSLIDVQRMDGVAEEAFALMLEFLQRTREQWRERVLKQALVCNEGLTGSSVIGMLHHTKPAYPVQVFTRRAEALAWLEVPSGFAAALEDVEAASAGRSAFELQVIAAIDALGQNAGPEAVAAKLGTSVRSMQRKLQQGGSSWRSLSEQSKRETARRLLTTTSAPIAEIARRVGFATSSGFVAWFVAHEGETPRRWRMRTSRDAAAE